MKVQIQHSCSHNREIEVKGVREARQYSKWLSEKECPECQDKADKAAEKAAQDLAVTQFMQMGVKELAKGVYSVPSQIELQPHITMVDSEGNVSYCSCKWFKNGGFARHICKHGEAALGYIKEQQAQETQEVVEAAQEYIKVAKGGNVRKSSQTRSKERGEFSLLR